jgi:DnaJ-class molecular chaperone
MTTELKHICQRCNGTGEIKMRKPTIDVPTGRYQCIRCNGAGKLDDRANALQVYSRQHYANQRARCNRWE